MSHSRSRKNAIAILCAVVGTVLAIMNLGERAHFARLATEVFLFLPLFYSYLGLRIGVRG